MRFKQNTWQIIKNYENLRNADLNILLRLSMVNRCRQFQNQQKKYEFWSRKVSFFEVWGALLASKKERKNETFRKVKNIKKACDTQCLRHLGPSRRRPKWGRKGMKISRKILRTKVAFFSGILRENPVEKRIAQRVSERSFAFLDLRV